METKRTQLDIIKILLDDMETRLATLKYDEVIEKYYFKNIPNSYLLWSARNETLNNKEKEWLKNLLVDNGIIFNGPNMRWFINVITLGKLNREVMKYVSIN